VQPRASATLDTTPASGNAPDASTVMPLFSASKWLFSAYFVQLRGGVLSPTEVQSLNMSSGYHRMANGSCNAAQSVADCDLASNSSFDPAGTFHYNSGHFQHLGAGLAIGIDHNVALKSDMDGYLPGLNYVWDTPELAGGASDSAGDYRLFLRLILTGSLLMKDALGTDTVLTNPTTTGCVDGPATNCVPGLPFANENLHYSLGHWVEDDASSTGDGAFSSPGFAGFYPWIDSTKSYYGIVARYVANPLNDSAFNGSITCGRLIRRAWLRGIEQ